MATQAALLDLVKIEEDGTVEGLNEMWEQLGNRYPFLFDDANDDNEPEPRPKAPRPTTGTGRRQVEPGALNSAALKERFPTLKRRRKV
jgi:hypothetical protein